MRELIEANIDEASTKPPASRWSPRQDRSRSARDGCEAAACVRRARAGFARRRVRQRSLRGDCAGIHRAAHAGQGQDRRRSSSSRPKNARRAEAAAGANRRRSRGPANDEALRRDARGQPPRSARTPSVPFAPADRGAGNQSGCSRQAAGHDGRREGSRHTVGQGRTDRRQDRASPSLRRPQNTSIRAPRHAIRSGWAIQVGAYEDEGEAKQHLSAAKSKVAQALQKAEAYIERTVQGRKDLLPRAFRRLRSRAGGSRLQALQARRRRLHGVEDLSVSKLIAPACRKSEPAQAKQTAAAGVVGRSLIDGVAAAPLWPH